MFLENTTKEQIEECKNSLMYLYIEDKEHDICTTKTYCGENNVYEKVRDNLRKTLNINTASALDLISFISADLSILTLAVEENTIIDSENKKIIKEWWKKYSKYLLN